MSQVRKHDEGATERLGQDEAPVAAMPGAAGVEDTSVKLTAITPEARDHARRTMAGAGFAHGANGEWYLQSRSACRECGERIPANRRKYCSDRCGDRWRQRRNRLHRKKYELREELGLATASQRIRERHLAMIAARASGMTYREIGERYGTDISHAWYVCNRSSTARNAPQLARVAVMVEADEYVNWKAAAGSIPLAAWVRECVREIMGTSS